MPSPAEIAAKLREMADCFDSCQSSGDPGAFPMALMQTKRYVDVVNLPFLKIFDQIFIQPSRLALVRVAIDIKLFEELAKDNDKPRTVQDLASALNVDPILLKRIMRALAVSGDLKEHGADTYLGTEYSQTFATSAPARGAIVHAVDHWHKSLWNLPKFLRETGHKDPDDIMHSPGRAAWGGLSYFEYAAADPVQLKALNDFMSIPVPGLINWFERYPAKERLLDGYEPNLGPLVIDMGGGIGAYLKSFAESIPKSYPLMIQELPEAAAHARREGQLPENIEVMEHDFFTPQPVKAARAYYLRHILHDWPDVEAKKILDNLRPAMKPGYSRLLIDEDLLGDEKVMPMEAFKDIAMMAIFASKERTRKEWDDLLTSSGFRLVKVWGVGRRVIEAEVQLD